MFAAEFSTDITAIEVSLGVTLRLFLESED
jgi:hypothetical protein